MRRLQPQKALEMFARLVEGKSQLFVVNADGTGETRLGAGAGEETNPSWSQVP